jgi:hypothetical protein
VGTLVSFGKSVFDTASQIGDLSEQLGISAEAVQGFKFAAEQSGSSLDAVGAAIGKMNQKLATGDASTVSALKSIGLGFEQVRAMKPEDAFLAITDQIQKIPDPMEQARVAMELFGKSGAQLLPAIKEGLRGVADGASKMSNETIKSLKEAQDAWSALGNQVTIVTGNMIASTMSVTSHITSSFGNFAKFVANAAKFGIGQASVMADLSAAAEKVPAAVDPATAAIKGSATANAEAAKAADEHAKKIKGLQDALFGRTTIAAANDYLQALGKFSNLTKVSADDQKKLNTATGEAIDAYKRLGQTAPAAMLELYSRTVVIPPLVDTATLSIRNLGHEVELTIPSLYEMPKAIAFTPEALREIGKEAGIQIPQIPKHIKTATDSLSEMSRSLAELATIAGGTFGGIARDLSTLVSAAAAAAKGIKEIAKGTDDLHEGSKAKGILELVAGISDLTAAAVAAGKAIASLFSSLFDRNKGRDLVVDFAETLGGFDALHVKLQELGDEGEQLWIKLTQGVGRNNPQQAQAAIDEVTKALDKQSQKQDDATQATEEGALATIETATQASQALDLVGEKLDTNKGQWSDWSAAVMAEIQKVASSLGAVVVPSPSAPTAVPGFAGGTRGAYLDFGAGTPVMLHGRERVMTEREGRQAGGFVGTTIVQVDGREVARASTRYQRQVLAPYGVR